MVDVMIINNEIYRDIETLRHEANECIQRLNWTDAADILKKVAEIDPLNAWVRQWQVITAMALERYDDVIVNAKVALVVISEDDSEGAADIAYMLGKALVITGRLDEALHYFSRAILLNPSLDCAEYDRNLLLNS